MVLQTRIVSAADISAVFADTGTFVASVAAGAEYDPADLYVQDTAITTAVDHQTTIYSTGGQTLSNAAETLNIAMNSPMNVVAAIEHVVGPNMVGTAVTRATVSYAVGTGTNPATPTAAPRPGGSLAAAWEEPESPTADPRLAGLLVSVGAVFAIGCVCFLLPAACFPRSAGNGTTYNGRRSGLGQLVEAPGLKRSSTSSRATLETSGHSSSCRSRTR